MGKEEGGWRRKLRLTVVEVGAVEAVLSVLDGMLRHLHAEVIRVGAGLYWARHVGAGEVVALASTSTMRLLTITCVASGPTIVTGDPL